MEFLQKYIYLAGAILPPAVLLCIIASTQESSAEENNWMTASQLNLKMGTPINESGVHKNVPCAKTVFYALEFKGVDLAPTKVPKDVCAAKGGLAQIGDGYIKPAGATYGYRIDSIGSGNTFSSAPNGQNFIRFARTPGSNISKQMYIHDNIRSAGDFVSIYTKNYKGVVYQYRNNDSIQPVKLSDGSALDMREYAYSDNGKWMVVEWVSQGLVRINLQTRETTLFSHQSHSYSAGTVTMSLSISNDGNTVISSSIGGLGASPIYIHDLAGCQTGRAFKLFDKNIDGCSQKIITDNVKISVPGDYQSLTSMRFSSDGRSIDALVRTQEGAVINTYQTIISPDPIGSEVRRGYVALGDSFASGEGDKDNYEEGTDVESINKCHLSKGSYPYLIAGLYDYDSFNSFACSGAKQINILSITQYSKSPRVNNSSLILPGSAPQSTLLKETDKPDFITVSIGGNDVGFANKLMVCVAPGDCKYAVDPTSRKKVAAEIANSHESLVETYREIKTSTKDRSKIYVISYPIFVDDDPTKDCEANVRLSHSERIFIREAIIYMNQVIESAAKSAGVHYVDVSDALKGYELCSDAERPEMAFNGFTEGDDKFRFPVILSAGSVYAADMSGLGNESFHPNARGHKLMQQAIIEELGGDPADFQTCTDDKPVCAEEQQPIPEPGSYFGSESTAVVKAMNGLLPVTFVPPLSRTLIDGTPPGKLARIIVDGLAPNSEVNIEAHSTPTNLGTYFSDASGKVTVEVVLPESIKPGYHTINLYGTNLANEAVHYYQDIYLTGSAEDLNDNKIPDAQESCFFTADSGIDGDEDNVDDACDGDITEPPDPDITDGGGFTPVPVIKNPGNPKEQQGTGETEAGDEQIINTPSSNPPAASQPPSTSQASTSSTPALAASNISSAAVETPQSNLENTEVTSQVLGNETEAATTAAAVQQGQNISPADRMRMMNPWALIAGASLIAAGSMFVWRRYQTERSI